ncbi:alsin [Euwallacea similis]|uniref:alsin n=1 Tax=Euwallacea similis TaxID=1736056 RepID=UPI00344B73B7
MNQSFILWIYNKSIEVKTSIKEPVKNIANINNHIFILTNSNVLYQGTIEGVEKKHIEFTPINNFFLTYITSHEDKLFIVNPEGAVLICNENLTVLKEIYLVEQYKCALGHESSTSKVKVKTIAVNTFGALYVCENNQLWASGYMPQIGINENNPKKVVFFSGRLVHAIAVGVDFAVIVINKQIIDEFEATLSFTPLCQVCSLHSQGSHSSTPLSGDLCPLGVKLDTDIEESTAFRCYGNERAEDELIIKEEKNIIFRNTEAAKEFLTRQISRMSSVGEEYLIECTEKPTRIIKENMSNVATFVYEGVKTVGDKVATLSRHVSSSSDHTYGTDNNNEGIHRKNSKEDFLLSVSQSTSERDFQDLGVQENIDHILSKGNDLLSREVWMWGNFKYGYFDTESKDDFPVIISALSKIGVSKVNLQNIHACAVTLDGRTFVWGRNNDHQVTLENKADQSAPKLFVCNMNEKVMDAACGSNFTMILSNKTNVTYFGKFSQSYQTIYHKFMSECENRDTEAVKPLNNLISSNEYVLLNLGVKCDEGFNQFVVKEQLMLEEMICVNQQVIKLLSKKSVGSENADLYQSLCIAYKDMLFFLTASVESLLEHRNSIIPLIDIMLLKYCKEFLQIYRNYVDTIQNIVSINGFEYLTKILSISPQLHTLRSGILKDQITKDRELSFLLLSPLKRIVVYSEFFRKFANLDSQFKFKDLVDFIDIKVKEAEKTSNFWLNEGKIIDYLKAPKRRLISDSHEDPISLHNAGRFSSHRFILFSDIFVHINGSTSHQHPLDMIWLEIPHHELLHLICLKMPEDTLTLVAADGVTKNSWYHALQQAIKGALKKPELLQPPLARKGTYKFTKAGFFKDASFSGRWVNAKMHGSGKVAWSDGKSYTGQFNSNVLSGYGIMEIPNVGTYEGEWRENKQDGYGTYTYCNKDIYKGYFKDGAPHGHGLLRKGNFMANSASLYIGEWDCGKKSGYGVMDDIATGKKYLGHWSDCKRQGSGLIVTTEGTYYEGNFHNDSLSGHGVMVLDDGTHYEGDFKGTGLVGGKGIVTLPSGHIIEGTLTGSMDEGIKISAGVLRKEPDLNSSLPKSFGTLCTPPSEKWKALFKRCHAILGLPEKTTGASSSETPRIWQNVAVYLSSATTLKKNKGDDGSFQNSLNNLDVIPPFGRDSINVESYREIKSYLHRAFESTFHPLGSLLNNLCEAYISSYSGKVHPILVNHAISEIIDITERVFDIVGYLFPALPDRNNECIVSNLEGELEVISYRSLLYPVILPKVYNSLCTLLSLKNEAQEKQYKKVLIEWNKLSDRSLMSVLSVEKKFFNLDQCINLSDKSCAFLEAIETLQQIISMFLPLEKLMIIRNTVDKMTPIAQNLLGNSYVWNMDDLFPLFLYVVVRARIPHLGAELEFMEYFMDQNLENGELGIMFTTLKACYQQILQDKSFFY